MMNKPDYIVASLSGGKDSSALVLRKIELGERIDEVICCDTYKEFPAMYRHLEKMQKVIEAAGIKFTMLRAEKTFDYLMFEHNVKRKNKALEGLKGYSWAGPHQRWCTSKLKVDVINKYLAELRSKYNVIQLIGIAYDEQYRLEREYANRDDVEFSLVKWKWVEETCLQYCYSKGFDWEGLYELFDRVSCWCCPLQTLKELRNLRKHFPDLWVELIDMDNRTWRKFRADYSAKELDIRFAFEEERQAQGLSITSREFFAELKKRLGAVNG